MQAELLDTGSLARSIEAVLFVASESLSIKTLAKLTGADEAEVTLALQQIDADYASRGIVLREIAGGYRFASAPAARSAVEAYLMPPKTNLSPAALETLAIVAYMQPVTKGDIEGIRGVSADSVLSTLVDRRFLAEAGRKDVAGRPILYKTTADFLEAFGLRSLEELPPIDIDADAPIELAFPIMTQPSSQTESAGTDTQAAVVEPVAVEGEASAAVVEGEASAAVVEGEASVAAVEGEASAAAVEGEASAAVVEGEAAAVLEGESKAAVVEPQAVEVQSIAAAGEPEAAEVMHAAGQAILAAGEPEAVADKTNLVAAETVGVPPGAEAEALGSAVREKDSSDADAASHVVKHAEIAATTVEASPVAGGEAESDPPTPLDESETVFVS